MEGAQGQLGARLTNTLGSDDSRGSMEFNQSALGQVPPVAHLAGTPFGLAGEGRPDVHPVDSGINDFRHLPLIYLLVAVNDDLPCFWMDYLACRHPVADTLGKRRKQRFFF